MGSEAMKASAGKPQSIIAQRRCRQGTGRGGSAQAGLGPAAAGAASWPQVRIATAAAILRCGEFAALSCSRVCLPLRLGNCAETACAVLSCTQATAGPPSAAVSPLGAALSHAA